MQVASSFLLPPPPLFPPLSCFFHSHEFCCVAALLTSNGGKGERESCFSQTFLFPVAEIDEEEEGEGGKKYVLGAGKVQDLQLNAAAKVCAI